LTGADGWKFCHNFLAGKTRQNSLLELEKNRWDFQIDTLNTITENYKDSVGTLPRIISDKKHPEYPCPVKFTRLKNNSGT